jgi:UPF0755 protein
MVGAISRKRVVFLVVFFCFLILMFLSVGFGFFLMRPAGEGEQDQIFLVRHGATLKEVSEELEERGIVAGRGLFLLWARLMGYNRAIKAGEYLLNSGMAPIKILEILSKGNIITHAVTIPEGYTVEQIGELLNEKGIVDKNEFLALARDKKVAEGLGISGPGLEGYLYPDTYNFGRGHPSPFIVDVMVRRFNEIYDTFRKRTEALKMSKEEVVTLASIVEKETGLGTERPLIASVFLNRLHRGMRLESDPTVIYGLKDFDGNLKRKHLQEYSPYNTYVIRGLPPGPIANPGREALKAVLYPAETDYLYFVSKNDGSHYFSKNLSEHNRAVKMYQKRKRKKPGKTP